MIANEYAAGFFDGEGTVYAAVRHNDRRDSLTVLVCIANVVPLPLELFKARWGGSIHARKAIKNRQTQYQWVLAPRGAMNFLSDIAPHLIIKKEVSLVALELMKLLSLPHRERLDYSHTVFKRGRLWVSPKPIPEFRDKITALHSRIRELNVRGAPANATRKHNIIANALEPTPNGGRQAV